MLAHLKNKTEFFVLMLLLIFVVGFGVGWASREGRLSKTTSVREISSDFKFVAPILFVKTPEEDSFPEYRHLKDAITIFSKHVIQEGKVEDLSIYFRNLNTSQWVGVNTTNRFAPASMLKVVTLVAVLREAEKNPGFLKSTVELPPANKLPAINQDEYGPRDPLMPGNVYTVERLIENLIIDSDNAADYVLRSVVGQEKMFKIYDDLEIPRANTAESENGYTTQEYSRLFRTLYNATYLSRGISEQVLDLLSRTNFVSGIVQGVPEDIVVSHKFGVRTIIGVEGAHRELHDCGIVYFPNHPYFLCVMTRGKEFLDLEGALKESSQIVWQEVSRLHQ